MGIIQEELVGWGGALLSGFIQWGLPLVGALGLLYVGYRLKLRAKKVIIPNRDILLRAIAEVQQTSGALLNAQEYLDGLNLQSPNTVHFAEALTARDNAHDSYQQAMNKLNAETMVAGKPFKDILYELSGYISTQVWLKTEKPRLIGGTPKQGRILTALEYFGRIAGKINQVTQKMEEISGQAPDKESSQKQ